jgi:hypothetical protein
LNDLIKLDESHTAIANIKRNIEENKQFIKINTSIGNMTDAHREELVKIVGDALWPSMSCALSNANVGSKRKLLGGIPKIKHTKKPDVYKLRRDERLPRVP